MIVDRVGGASDASFFRNEPMGTATVDVTFKSIRQLVKIFEGRTNAVSKAGPKIAAPSRAWLGVHRLGLIAPPGKESR